MLLVQSYGFLNKQLVVDEEWLVGCLQKTQFHVNWKGDDQQLEAVSSTSAYLLLITGREKHKQQREHESRIAVTLHFPHSSQRDMRMHKNILPSKYTFRYNSFSSNINYCKSTFHNVADFIPLPSPASPRMTTSAETSLSWTYQI